MGIFSGILCLICFCLLLAKAATSKLHFKNIDKLLLKIHKPVSLFCVIICFVHIFYVVPILKNRNMLIVISGITSVFLMVLSVSLCHIIKDKKKNLFWHRTMAVLMAIGIICHFISYIIDFNNYKQIVADIEIDNINLANVADGLYTGEYDAGYIYAKAEIKVKNGVIVSINLLEHRNERGKLAENIIGNIISEQKIDVDIISGATNSSNVIKKAIEKAVKNK